MSGLGKGTFWGLRCGRGGQVVELCPRLAIHYKYMSSAVILEVSFKDRVRVRGDALVMDRVMVVSSVTEDEEPMGNRSEMTGLMLPSPSCDSPASSRGHECLAGLVAGCRQGDPHRAPGCAVPGARATVPGLGATVCSCRSLG